MEEENFDKTLICIDRIDGSVELFDYHQSNWQYMPKLLQLPTSQLLFEVQVINNGSLLLAFSGRDLGNNTLNSVWSRNPSDLSSQWTVRAPMNKSRNHFTSAVFDNNIYVFGGNFKDNRSENVVLRSCECYDSQLNQWSIIDSMKVARKNASAVVFNGCIYIAGGINEYMLTEWSVEKYDPQSKNWNEISPMRTARSHFALTSFAGRLWAIGGRNSDKRALSSVESYDLKSNEWNVEKSLNAGRIGHSAIEFNEDLYVVCGFKQNFKNAVGSYVSSPTKIVENYFFGSAWSETVMLQKVHPFSKMIIAFNLNLNQLKAGSKQNSFNLENNQKQINLKSRKNISTINSNNLNQADLLPIINVGTNKRNQLIVCIEKYDGFIEYYDSQHNSWHSSTVSLKLPNGQESYQLALLGSMLYAFGGTYKSPKALNLVWSRDLSDASSKWTARANMNKCRKWHCSVVLNDTIYVMGGWDKNDKPLSSCERFSSQLNQWSTVADMKTGRFGASAAVFNGCIYIAGGKSGRRVVRSVEKYDPQSNEWSQMAPMSTARFDFALTSFAGRLWAIGGRGYDHKPLSLVESYDPVTDSWREEAPLREMRFLHAAIEFNRKLYAVGGLREGDNRVVEKYVPTIGWVEDSALQEWNSNPHLLIIPPAYSSFFTTDSNQSFTKTINKRSCCIS